MAWKILVVDDEVSITNVVAMKLRNAGLDVVVALDGQEAYELAKADRPDFMITDLQMPGMSGLELCARLAAEWDGGVPTILLTAKGFELDDAAILNLPIRRVMTKPFGPRELLAYVQEVLGECASTERQRSGG
jgi:two-component system alkaline phosphatase synthesis response regulator PhoP